MVRTAATAIRASGGKSSKAVATNSSTSSAQTSTSRDKGSGGGNTVFPREIPRWQKPISTFFRKLDTENESINTCNPAVPYTIPECEHESMNNINDNFPSQDTTLPGTSRCLSPASSSAAHSNFDIHSHTNNETEKKDEIAMDDNKENNCTVFLKRNTDSHEELPAKKLRPAFYRHLEDFECA